MANTNPCSRFSAPSKHRKMVGGPRSKNIPKSEPRALANGSQIEVDFRKRNRDRNEQTDTCGSVFGSENRPRFRSRLPARAHRFSEHFWTVDRISFFDVCWSPRGGEHGSLFGSAACFLFNDLGLDPCGAVHVFLLPRQPPYGSGPITCTHKYFLQERRSL